MSDAPTTAGIADAVRRMHASLDAIRDELNAADRVMGDGDTGMTVASVVTAWHAALSSEYGDVGAMLQALGRETRRATGSSLGSVMGIGLSAAGRSGAASAVAMLDAAVAAITERSGAAPGDKTILDALIAIRDAVAQGRDPVEGAREALEAFRTREAKIGRARIYGAKSAGHDDPGMLAALLLLRAVRSKEDT
jgi:phosphoenolpyruvate---glycerone phosphotransferase subunit DhaL